MDCIGLCCESRRLVVAIPHIFGVVDTRGDYQYAAKSRYRSKNEHDHGGFQRHFGDECERELGRRVSGWGSKCVYICGQGVSIEAQNSAATVSLIPLIDSRLSSFSCPLPTHSSPSGESFQVAEPDDAQRLTLDIGRYAPAPLSAAASASTALSACYKSRSSSTFADIQFHSLAFN